MVKILYWFILSSPVGCKGNLSLLLFCSSFIYIYIFVLSRGLKQMEVRQSDQFVSHGHGRPSTFSSGSLAMTQAPRVSIVLG